MWTTMFNRWQQELLKKDSQNWLLRIDLTVCLIHQSQWIRSLIWVNYKQSRSVHPSKIQPRAKTSILWLRQSNNIIKIRKRMMPKFQLSQRCLLASKKQLKNLIICFKTIIYKRVQKLTLTRPFRWVWWTIITLQRISTPRCTRMTLTTTLISSPPRMSSPPAIISTSRGRFKRL